MGGDNMGTEIKVIRSGNYGAVAPSKFPFFLLVNAPPKFQHATIETRFVGLNSKVEIEKNKPLKSEHFFCSLE